VDRRIALGMLMVGIAAVVMGVGLLSIPGAFVVGGLALIALAVSEAWPEPTGRPRTRGKG